MSSNDRRPRSAVVVRGTVTPSNSYQAYRPSLRRDFWYSCAYCTMSEVESYAVGFQIDHYLPQSAHPELSSEYSNLYWACQPCNRNKGGYSPTREESTAGRAFIRADVEHPRDHLADSDDDSGEWIPLTPKGTFNIDWLDLNRPGMARLRRVRRSLAASYVQITFGVTDILAHGVDAVRREHKGYLARLHRDAQSLAHQWEQGVEDYIRQCLASPLIDDAPPARRRHLQEEGALVPGLKTDTNARTKRRHRHRRRR